MANGDFYSPYSNYGSLNYQSSGAANLMDGGADVSPAVPKGAASTAGLALTPFLGPGALVVGSILDFGLNMYGMHKQERENQRVEAAQTRLYEQERGDRRRSELEGRAERQKSERGTLRAGRQSLKQQWKMHLNQLGLSEKQLDFTKERFSWEKDETEKATAERKDERRYKRAWDFGNRFATMLNQDDNRKAGMINRWQSRGRRAA